MQDFVTWHNERTINKINSIEECSCVLKDDYIKLLHRQLNQAINYLQEYAGADDEAGLNGSGCYSDPNEVVNKWIKNIEETE